MWSWVKRHKLKTTVLVAGAGICAGAWYVLRKAGQLPERREDLEATRLKEQNESNRQTCLVAVLGLVPRVQEAVCQQLDVEAITAQLRTGPANKVALWETLRTLCEPHPGPTLTAALAPPLPPTRFCSSGDRCVCVYTPDCVPACPAEHPGRVLVAGPTQHTTVYGTHPCAEAVPVHSPISAAARYVALWSGEIN